MNQSRFRISHLILFLFLMGFGCTVGYMIISAWIWADFTPWMLLYIPTFCLGVILPIYSVLALIIDDIKKIRAGESTAMYEETKES